MRTGISVGLVFAVLILTSGEAFAALPIRKPDVEATIEKVVPATDGENGKGILVTLFLKDRKEGVPVTKETLVHRQMGKLVPVVEASEIKSGQKVSVWLNAKTGRAEGVLIFP